MGQITREQIIAYQDDMKAFGVTRAGSAFFRFENALGKAWITDQRENASMKSMERDWAISNAARQELIEAIKELQRAREVIK
jgi:hypothetical protein